MHSANRDMFLAHNLNPMPRANTTRTGAITRADAFGVLGETYTRTGVGDGEHRLQRLRRPESVAREALREQLVRPHLVLAVEVVWHGGKPDDKNTYQTADLLNLDQWDAPSSVDRRHILSLNGRTEDPAHRRR